MRTLYIRVKLQQLRCHDKPDGWSNGEPYLWNIFFKIDGSCIILNDRFRLEGRPAYHFSKGSQGNLSAKSLESGGMVPIPEEVGEWKASLVPITIPYFEAKVSGVAGLVSVLIEQNLVSGSGAEAGHEAFNKYVVEALDSVIRGFDPKLIDLANVDASIKNYFEEEVRKYTDNISNLVGQAVSSSQTILQNFLSLVKKDVVIGYKIWDFSTEAILAAGGELAFSHRWETKKSGDWELKGRIYANVESETTNALKKVRSRGEEEEE
jgi:hypothetical protein